MTSFTRISAMTRKEFIHLLRDRRTLAVVLVMPVLQMLLCIIAGTLLYRRHKAQKE